MKLGWKEAAIMGLGRGIKRWFKRRKQRWGRVVLGALERDIALELGDHAARLAMDISPELDRLVEQGILTPEGKAQALAAVAGKLDKAVPRWADSIVDRVRRALRLNDDD